jgi:integrase
MGRTFSSIEDHLMRAMSLENVDQLDRVSVLLGHQSIRVTERHYAPWTRSRQEQLESDLKRAWSEDPIAIAQVQGTQQVHGKTERPN